MLTPYLSAQDHPAASEQSSEGWETRGMDRRLAFALAVYVALMASLATPLYEPLSDGRDDSWALVVLFAGAHLAVGISVRRAWVLLLPIGLAVVGFLFSGAGGLAWLILMFGAPVLIAATALGWLLGRRLTQHTTPIALVAFIVAAVPGMWAAVETAKRGAHVSGSAQRALPTLAPFLVHDLCFKGDSRLTARTPTRPPRRARRQFAALERSLRADPNMLVTVRFALADAPGLETREMTVRELAETHLGGADPSGLPSEAACYRSGRARLERLLEQAG